MSLKNLAICFGPNLFDVEGAESMLAGATSKKSVSPSTTAELQMAGLRPELDALKAQVPAFPNDTLSRNLVKSSRSSSLGSLHGRRSPSHDRDLRDLDISLPVGAGTRAGAGAGAGAAAGVVLGNNPDTERSLVINECTLLMLQNYQNLFAVCQTNVC